MNRPDYRVFNNSRGRSCYNFTFEVLRDFSRMSLNFELRMKSDKNSDNFDVRVMEENFDYCNLNVEKLSNYIVKALLPGKNALSNLHYKCPMKRGPYFMLNIEAPMLASTYLRNFLPALSYQWQMTIISRAKISPNSPAVRAFTLNCKGVAIR